MKRTRIICIVTIFVAVMMISIGLVLEKDLNSNNKYSSESKKLRTGEKFFRQTVFPYKRGLKMTKN